MASRLYSIPMKFRGSILNCRNEVQQHTLRRLTTTQYGGVIGQPAKTKFGLIKALVVVTPFLYLGATISKEGAALLEDYGYFVPEDDDDDD